jgi:hypothetical protein
VVSRHRTVRTTFVRDDELFRAARPREPLRVRGRPGREFFFEFFEFQLPRRRVVTRDGRVCTPAATARDCEDRQDAQKQRLHPHPRSTHAFPMPSSVPEQSNDRQSVPTPDFWGLDDAPRGNNGEG